MPRSYLPARAVPALLAALALAGPLSAQKLTLSKPDAEYAEPFTEVRGIRELPDGRVLVSDWRDKVVMLLDLKAGTAVKIGREGQGPEEYAMPMALWATPDGGALLQDMGNRRFLPIGADGKVGRALTPPQPPAPPAGGPPGGMMIMGGLVDARGVDGQGRLYFQGMAITADGSGADSVPIMRWDRAAKVDTVAWVPLSPDMRPQVTRGAGGNTMMVRIGGGVAWPKQVQWGVAPDGRIALVEPEPYRVTWLGSGTRRTGQPVTYTPVRVTEAEKKEYRDQQSRARPVMMTVGGTGGTAPPAAARPTAGEDPKWPDTKPPFTGTGSVLVTPDGQVWVGRARRANDPTPTYDVFDGSGNLAGQVTLRPRSRVVGFGKGTVYVVRSDEDDLQYLERYRR